MLLGAFVIQYVASMKLGTLKHDNRYYYNLGIYRSNLKIVTLICRRDERFDELKLWGIKAGSKRRTTALPNSNVSVISI